MSDLDAAIKHYFATARERMWIYERRLGRPGHPTAWTKDKVFAENRFCNVFRELDRTTAWFRENMRDLLAESPSVVLATVAFRWFNKIEIGRVLTHPLVGLMSGWFDAEEAKRLILTDFPAGPFVTGAYIIKTPDGMKKLDGVLWCINQFLERMPKLMPMIEDGDCTLEEAWKVLRQSPFLGDFMAYEIVTDLRHTYVLRDARDIDLWANPGPGCARGLGRIFRGDPEAFNRGSEKDRKLMAPLMQELLACSRDPAHWPESWPAWEMREVEHWLCEFDKYCRVLEGGKMKQRFRPLLKVE